MKLQSIRTKLSIAIVTVGILLIGIMLLIYQYVFSEYVEDEAYRNMELLIQQSNKAIESSFSMIENSVNYFFMDRTLREWTELEKPDATETLLAKLDLDEAMQHSLLTNSAWENDLMCSAYFYVDQYSFTFYSNGTQPIFALTKMAGRISKTMDDKATEELQIFVPETGGEVFFIGKSYIDEKDSNKNLNILIAVDEDVLCAEYQALLRYDQAQAWIVDREGNIFSAKEKEAIGTKLEGMTADMFREGHVQNVVLDGEKYYISGRQVSQTGLWLISKIPQKSYTAAMIQVARQYVVIVCVVLTAFLLIALFAVNKGTSFLAVIEKNFAEIRSGNYDVRMPKFKASELNELSRTFNNMTEQIDYLIHEVYEKQIEAKKADLKFLQSQINPHFLFNTLATVGTKAKLVKEEEIYRMVSALSTLLQASFQQGEQGMVTIEQELEYVRCYLYIQKERFGKKLDYQIEVEKDESLLKSRIPKLCLEPIVENAVIHGVEPKRGRGIIRIQIARNENDIIMSVSDNGSGFQGTIKPVEEYSQNGSIGLKNTQKRLQMMYGSQYGISIDQTVCEGAKVVVRIPIQNLCREEEDVQGNDC